VVVFFTMPFKATATKTKAYELSIPQPLVSHRALSRIPAFKAQAYVTLALNEL
jgi:hypothetical protein